MLTLRSLSLSLIGLLLAAAGALSCASSAFAQREHSFGASFGGEGSGNGQLMRPGAIAVNESTGDVYVLDRGNGRVEQFSSAGGYVGQFDGSSAPTGAFSWPVRQSNGNTEPSEGAIAVDNSTNPLDPSAGDVYVVDTGHRVIDKFSASGVYVGQITGPSATSPFAKRLQGVAVDGSGALWVHGYGVEKENNVGILEFSNALANEYVSELSLIAPAKSPYPFLATIGLAIDGEGSILIGQQNFGNPRVLSKFNAAGTELIQAMDGATETTGLAADTSSNDIYGDEVGSVAAFTPSGSLIERFGSGQIHGSEGIAVDSATGTVYASDTANQTIEAFNAFVVPDVTTAPASNVGETTAIVNGSVNPDGLAVTSCVFEYGTTTSYGQTAPCSPSPGSGSGPVSVSASLSGLSNLTQYHFRLNASNANGSNVGQDRTFLTPTRVSVSEEGVSDVSSTSAAFSALVNPGGSDTTFHFEYGPTTAYGQSVPVPDGDIGAGTSAAPVRVHVEGLQPQTTYHARLVATNALGTVYGPDEVFTTQAPGTAFTLPDGRMWEMVSPPNKYGATIELSIIGGVNEAASAGGAITYQANGPTEPDPAGNASPVKPAQVLSRREGGRWSSQDIAVRNAEVVTPTEANQEYLFFSSDLSRALVEPPTNLLLSPQATERTVYVRDNHTGEYIPLVTASNAPSGVPFGGEEVVDGEIGTPDLSHVLLRSRVPLTENAPRQETLYEWADGKLTLVTVLPDGTPTAGVLGDGRDNIRNAVSNDGSLVFWKQEQGPSGPLYMTDTATGATTQVDAPQAGVSMPPHFDARFEIASADGSKVFFVENEPLTAESTLPASQFIGGPRDLYVYDTREKRLTDLSVDHKAGEAANVADMVLGASEDGSVVYFVATGALASGAEAGKDNLYVVSASGATWSAPRLVTVLSPQDEATWGGNVANEQSGFTPAKLASGVSPNGRFLAFMSDRSLTGYDNRDAASGALDEEVFLYDELTGELRCASCDPTQARPAGTFDEGNQGRRPLMSDPWNMWPERWLAATLPAGDRTNLHGRASYQPRFLSDKGRLFFDGFDSLVAQDTNGKGDVYEYEPAGVGTCQQPAGCVSLISSGTASEESLFLDASATGPEGEPAEDAFFLTGARLTGQDYDTTPDVYDAHTCSRATPCIAVPVSPPECSSGDSCKAAPSPQPEVFGPAPSATFSGTGNVAASARHVTAKSLTRAQRLARALRQCRHKRDATKRRRCERRAVKRYRAKQARNATATTKGNG